MSDSGAVDAALFAALAADTALAALCPDGVWRDNAPQQKTRFVVVTQAAHLDTPMFHGTAFETFSYAVTAVLKDDSAINANSAAARIKAVVEALTTVSGYTLTMARRPERIAYSEPDPANPDAVWQHIGGLFEIMVSPT